MNNKNYLSAIAGIDEDLIARAEVNNEVNTMSNKITFNKIWLPIAACLVVAFVAVGFFTLSQNKAPVKTPDTPSINSQYNGDTLSSYTTTKTENNTTISDTSGLYIPAVELPKINDDSELDMLALVVYKGRIYTQAESYFADDAEKINELVGNYLGSATGSIDEWSTQNEYTKEFASSIAGEVYEVKGYDSNFRICIRIECENETGEKYPGIIFLHHLNDITVKTGEDIFESLLHITGRITDIQYQIHDDWDNGKNNIYNADIEPNLWNEFINQVNNADCVNTWDQNITDNTLLDNQNQTYIFLTMNDGTVISLRLLEGGFVGYYSCFVQIPGDIFNAVFAACGGNEE